MAATDIKVEQLGIGTVLKRFWLRVPKHQREYAWEEEHVKKLFEDLSDAIKREPPSPYFLGTIVTVNDADDLLLVVDGQQRLATTSLLLAAMREYLLAHQGEKRAEAIERLLWEIDSDLQEETPKLTLNIDDATLFRQIITNSAEVERSPRISHRRLLLAQQLARAHVANILAGLGEANHSDELNRWIKFLQSRVEVILLIVPDRGAAFKMFQTLNDRGLSASKADLIKSHLFEKAGDKTPGEVERGWSSMRMAIESANPGDDDATLDFLRYALIVQGGHLREADTFDRVEKSVVSPSSATSQVTAFESLASTYVATINPHHERWIGYPTTMRRALGEHVLLDVKPMRPLLMAVSAKMAPKEAAEAMTFLVSLAVRLNIASSTRTSTVEEPLGNAAPQVFSGTIDTAAKLRSALADITPNDAAFREEFARARVNNGKLARYYLRSLEEARSADHDPYFEPVDDAQSIDLEHVLPRRPESEWGFDEEEVAQLATRIGNLALIRKVDNAKLKSKPFAEKQETYGKTPYALTQYVAAFPAWNAESIDLRQRHLADIAVKAWPIRPEPTRRPPRPKRPSKGRTGGH